MIFEKTNVDQESFKRMAKEHLETTLNILIKKNKMYGGASMDMGMVGNYVHIHDKANRMKQLIEVMKMEDGKETVEFESLEDTLRDIVGYATIGLIILEAQEREIRAKLPASFQHPIPVPPEDAEKFPFGYDGDEVS